MLEYIAVYVVRILQPRPLLACSSAYFQAAFIRVPCAPAHGRNVRRLCVLQAAPARGPSTVAPAIFAAMWPAVSRGPVVGLENRPAPHVLHTNSFFRNHRGRRVRFLTGSGVEPRPAVRCGLIRSLGAVKPRPPVWPAPVVSSVGIWGAGLRIASRSLAMYANGGNASRSSVRCGYSAPQPPKNQKGIWAAGQAK